MERELHPSETPLFIAAALRGLRLQDTPDGRLYRVLKGSGATQRIVADAATFKDVANLCGATGNTTLREAAERDGLTWPKSAEAFFSVIKKIQERALNMKADQRQAHYSAGTATKLAVGAGIVAGVVVYLVNGQDPWRAAIAAAIWVAIGWHSGKALFPRVTNPAPASND